ncbi:MAG: MBOAT family O-acyltransferase [Chloroflexota bacterium]
MPLISLKFAIFVLASLLIYYLLPGKLQNSFLLLASYYFYVSWSWQFALILLALTVFNFFYAQHLQRCQTHKRAILWLGVAANLAFFLFFLLGSGLGDLIRRFGLTSFEVAVLLPLGFGYHVLESISYLVDISLRLGKPSTNFIDFTLFLAYFPKLISGPIERARKFLPQLSQKRVVDNQVLARSLMLIVIGLLRSTVLAGMITVLVPASVIQDPLEHTGFQLMMGLLGFAFYLYNQFAGYTDLVRGVSGLFGIELTRNFAQPIFSKDFSDFWQRWHISLSQWLRDYIYMPLSRALLRRNPTRSNKANLILPPLATMFASGLWHGGSPNLLAWGILNGLYVVIENFINLFRHSAPNAKRPLWRAVLGGLVLLGLALFAAIPFKLTLGHSRILLGQMLFAWGWQMPDLLVLAVMLASVVLDWLQFRRNDEFVFLGWPRSLQALAAVLAVFAVVIVYQLQNAPATFVYP